MTSPWQAQSIQLVWFTPQAAGVNVSHAFQEFFGEQPNLIQNNKTPSPQNPYLSVAAGSDGGMNVQISSQPGRVDFVLSPLEAEEAPPALTLADTSLALKIVRDFASKAKSYIPGPNRVAMVTSLLSPSTGPTESNAALIEALDGLDISDDASDISFQINRRKQLDIGISINRVLRFTTAVFQEFKIDMGPAPKQELSQIFAANLVIDLNSVPVPRPLTDAETDALWSAIFDETAQLSASGKLSGLGK